MHIIHTIDVCTMDQFQDCLVDRNYRTLIVGEGDADDAQLQEAWEDLQDQYTEALGNAEQKIFHKLLKETNIHSASLAELDACLEVLKCYYVRQFADKVNKLLGTNYNFEIIRTDVTQYDRYIAQAEMRKAGIEMKRDLARIRLEDLSKKLNAKKGEAPTRAYFGKMFNALEEHYQGTRADGTMTVARYCDRVQRLADYSLKVKSSTHGRTAR